ncbi:hypothetical protein [Stenomitos frigidus]|nr:hypothetical protein [Stenomitos frigidus]
MPDEIADLLEQKAAELQISKSQVALMALKNLLKPPDPADELSEVKQQLATLAAAMARISPDLPQRRS